MSTPAPALPPPSCPYTGPRHHAPAHRPLLPSHYIRDTWSDVSAALLTTPPACAIERAQLRALVDRQLSRLGGVR